MYLYTWISYLLSLHFSRPSSLPVLSASPLVKDTLVPQAPLCPFAGFAPMSPSLSSSQKPRTGCSISCVASPAEGWCQSLKLAVLSLTQPRMLLATFALRPWQTCCPPKQYESVSEKLISTNSTCLIFCLIIIQLFSYGRFISPYSVTLLTGSF